MFPPAPSAPDPMQSQVANELRPDGSGDPQPHGGDPSSLVTIPMTPEEVSDWRDRIKRATDRRAKAEATWDILLKAYIPVVQEGPQDPKVHLHFRNVHTKIGQLFYRSPELQLMPRRPALNQIPNPMPPMPGMPPPPPLSAEMTVSIKQEVLNLHLGREGVNAVRLMDELLFDALAWAGLMASKISYRVVTKTIQQPVTRPNPMTGVPEPALDATGQPQMQSVPVPVHEWYEWDRLSPKKVLFNDDLHSTRYDEHATFTGYDFFMSPAATMREFGVTEDEAKAGTEDDRVYKHDTDTVGRSKASGLVHGVALYYKASVFSDEPHPLAIRELIFLDSIPDRPVVHRLCEYQTFDAQGKLTDDSMVGFPVHLGSLRDLADSPYPMADSAFTDSNQKELSTFRRQKVALRDAAIGKYLVDEGAFGEGELDKFKNGPAGDTILMQEGRLAGGSKRIIDTTAQVMGTADDYRTESTIKHEADETLGIGSNQAGTPEATVRSATEIATVQTAVAGRLEKEQSRAIDYYLNGVRKFDSLLMRYATMTDYVTITGQDGAKIMAAWNNQVIAGKYLYDIKPDSQLRVDTAKDRQQTLALYNLTAKDPLVNRAEILKKVFRQFGYDPAHALLPPDQAAAMMQPPHGGPAAGGDAVNQHQAGQSGNVPNGPGTQGESRQGRMHPGAAEGGAPPTPSVPGRVQ
jgi:hypothetical protein